MALPPPVQGILRAVAQDLVHGQLASGDDPYGTFHYRNWFGSPIAPMGRRPREVREEIILFLDASVQEASEGKLRVVSADPALVGNVIMSGLLLARVPAGGTAETSGAKLFVLSAAGAEFR